LHVVLTAVRVKESHKAIFMAGYDDTFNAIATTSRAAHFVRIKTAVTAGFETGARGDYGVDAGGHGTIKGLVARHAYNLFASPCVVDYGRRIRVADYERFA
jgi:hypothetical protein